MIIKGDLRIGGGQLYLGDDIDIGSWAIWATIMSADPPGIRFNSDSGKDYWEFSNDGTTWCPFACATTGGTETFIGLIDTPDTYFGYESWFPQVNAAGTELIFEQVVEILILFQQR